jgi:hypothetical protein
MEDATLYGSFVPTTNIWDVIQELQEINVNTPEFKELLIRMYQNINLMAIVLNLKDSGIYQNQEFVNGQTYFSNPALTSNTSTIAEPRQVWRQVINFGSLPNATSKSVPHNIPITPAVTFTRIYATASDTTGNNYIPIPYASSSGTDNIELDVDMTNVTITTTSDRTNFGTTYVVLEYLKN